MKKKNIMTILLLIGCGITDNVHTGSCMQNNNDNIEDERYDNNLNQINENRNNIINTKY